MIGFYFRAIYVFYKTSSLNYMIGFYFRATCVFYKTCSLNILADAPAFVFSYRYLICTYTSVCLSFYRHLACTYTSVHLLSCLFKDIWLINAPLCTAFMFAYRYLAYTCSSVLLLSFSFHHSKVIIPDF